MPSAGQRKRADKSFAGQNKCNPKNVDQPFIIDWDATDQSSFQSHAASDVVFVHYEGCELKPESDASLNLAGQVKAGSDSEKRAAAYLDSSLIKKQARDGKACIAELESLGCQGPRRRLEGEGRQDPAHDVRERGPDLQGQVATDRRT